MVPEQDQDQEKRILFIVNEDWFFYSHRLALAKACIADGWRVSVATRVNAHDDAIKSHNIHLIPSRMARGAISLSAFWHEILTVLQLACVIRREKPAVMHLVGLKPVIFGWLATVLLPRPVTVNALTGMGYIFTSAKFDVRVIRTLIKWMLKRALHRRKSYLITQNKRDAADLLNGGIAAKERTLTIFGSGVDTGEFCPSPEPQGAVRITYVGRMLRDKGVEDLVRAAHELKQRRYDFELRLVGGTDPGNPTHISEEELREWDSEEFISWLGYRDDVDAVWRETNIAVLPSYREGMPMSLLEASASGRPLVSTRVQGCEELVEHGFNGYLVEPNDWRNLANALEELMLDAEKRREMGAAARVRVENRFDQKTVISSTLRLYERAMG